MDSSASCHIIKDDDQCGIHTDTFLPFRIQHIILESLQRRLEHAAFKFYQKKAPFILEKRGWSCSEEGEWNEWLKYLLRPDSKDALPDVFLENGILSAKGEDTLKKAFRIRDLAVHRERAPCHDVTNLARVANDIFDAFDDAQGAYMAQKYITMSLQVTKVMERSQEEMSTQQEAAVRESKAALESAHSIIKAHVEDNIRSELRGISDTISSVDATSLAPNSSTSEKQLPLTIGEVYQVKTNAADQTGRQVLMGPPWTSVCIVCIALSLLINMATICAIVYAPNGFSWSLKHDNHTW